MIVAERMLVEARIEHVCTFCENKAIGAGDPDAPMSKPPMCKVHFRIALSGEDHPFWPVMHPNGYCDRGGQCHVEAELLGVPDLTCEEE